MKIRLCAAVLFLCAILTMAVAPASAQPPQTQTAPLQTAAAQVAIPDTPAAHALTGWLDAFNSANRETYRAFLEKFLPGRLEHLDQEMSFRERTGGFDLKKIEDSAPLAVTVLLKERGSDQFARLHLEVESAGPHKITQLGLDAIATPPGFFPPPLSEADLLAAIAKQAETDTAADRFSGAVLLSKNGKPIFAKAYGLADREKKIPNTLSTRFRIGSMNKMFTATATLQLAQAGKLTLTDPVGKYLTDYPNKDVATKVTIHQLLTHTGGTGDIFTPEFEKHRLELRTLQDYEKLYGTRAPEFEPGSRWEYSNYGFILLGLIIEKVSGQTYYDYVHDHIFQPAGMTSTGSDPEDAPVPNRSVGYTKLDPAKPGGGAGGAWHPNTDTLPYRGTSAGGGYSTVEDLLRFANALESHKLLDAHYTDLLTTGKVDTPRGRYAYGFGDDRVGSWRCVGHGGGAPGMNGDLKICTPASSSSSSAAGAPGAVSAPGSQPDTYIIAVLSNLDPPAASRISDFITNRLPQH